MGAIDYDRSPSVTSGEASNWGLRVRTMSTAKGLPHVVSNGVKAGILVTELCYPVEKLFTINGSHSQEYLFPKKIKIKKL